MMWALCHSRFEPPAQQPNNADSARSAPEPQEAVDWVEAPKSEFCALLLSAELTVAGGVSIESAGFDLADTAFLVAACLSVSTIVGRSRNVTVRRVTWLPFVGKSVCTACC